VPALTLVPRLLALPSALSHPAMEASDGWFACVHRVVSFVAYLI